MAKESSFDVVSSVDMQEVDNAFQQAKKELSQRYDLKGSGAEITLDKQKKTITVAAPADFVARQVSDIIGSKLNYAYDERIGYLTQCPTNLGTAMRASVMLHLPALTRCGQIGKLAATVSKLGLVIRGAYGEGSSPRGDVYQLSNQITLGISEETALDNLQSITLQLVAQERAAAEKLLENPVEEDKIFRAKGILQNARVLSGDEFMELASLLRMGISNKTLDFDITRLNELSVKVQPATINALEGKELSPQERDIIRAEWVRKAFE